MKPSRFVAVLLIALWGACFTLAKSDMAEAQVNQLALAEAEMTRFEQLAEDAWQVENWAVYRDMLGEVLKLGLRYPEIDPLRRARAQSKLASYLYDRESDFYSAKVLALGALEVFRARLGENARETLQQRADLIYFRLQQAEMFDLLVRHGFSMHFGTGDPAIDGVVTDQDIAVFRALSGVVDREEPDENTRVVVWANYVGMLLKAERVDEAYAAITPRLRDLDARIRRGEEIPSNVRIYVALTVIDTFIAAGRNDWALQIYQKSTDDALHFLRSSIWQQGVKGVSGQREILRIFAEGFIKFAYRVAGDQPLENARALRHQAFEVAQFAGYNPAAGSVAQQSFGNVLADAALREDLVRWSQLAPQVADQVEEHRRLQKRINAAHPGFAEAMVPEPISIAELQGINAPAVLGKDEALILIFNTLTDPSHSSDAHGLVFAVTQEGSAWAELPLDWTDLSIYLLSLHYHLDPEGSLKRCAARAAIAGSGFGRWAG